MKTEIRPTPPPAPLARRKAIVIKAKSGRVITRPHVPAGEERIRKLVDRVLNLDEEQACAILETLLHDFSHRHRYFRQSLERNFQLVAGYVPNLDQVSPQRRLLIGSYFTAEYSVEAAAHLLHRVSQRPYRCQQGYLLRRRERLCRNAGNPSRSKLRPAPVPAQAPGDGGE
jgi:hypothetical protein